MIYRPAKNIAKELRKGKLYRQSAAVHVSDKKQAEAYARMRSDPSHAHESDEEIQQRAAYYLVWHQHGRPKARLRKRVLFGVVLLVLILLVLAGTAHCQLSGIKLQESGVAKGSVAGGFATLNFAGCTVSAKTNNAWTITCAGGPGGSPGGSDKQVQYNSAGSAFGGISFGTSGQILESCGSNCIPQFQDPIVSGPDAPTASSTKNPVQVAGNDGSVVRAIKTDASGNVDVVFPSAQHVVVDTAPSTAVTGTFWQSTQPVSIASMPSTPVTGTFWQVTQPVSGTVSAGVPALGQALAASSLPVVLTSAQLSTLTPPAVFGGVVTQGTGTNLHTVVDSGAVTATLGTETTKVIGTVNIAASQSVQATGGGTTNTSDAAWTSATAGNTAVTLISNTSQYNTIQVTLVQGTTITGGVVTFESSIDNSTWTSVQGAERSASAIMGPTYTLVASTNISFLFPVSAPYFRVRLSTGITGTGTVTIQHTALTFPLAAIMAGTQTLAAGSAVIGHVIADSGSTTAVTGNVTAIQGTGTNLHAVIDSGSTTAATQATGSNLHAVIDTGSTTAVTQATATNLHTAATLDAETTKVIGTVRSVGNIGGVFDAATNGAVPANQVWTVSTPTTAAGGALTTSVKATVTTSVNVKGSAGNVYGISVANGAAAVCWVQFINSATNGTLGSAVIFSIALPSSGVVNIPPGVFALSNFSTGIAVGVASSTNLSSACGTGANLTVFYD